METQQKREIHGFQRANFFRSLIFTQMRSMGLAYKNIHLVVVLVINVGKYNIH